jgi:curved DNA-binding protein CbpA
VTDAFAEFGWEQRPWLDPEAVQTRYHELAALRHPDKCGGDPLPLARLNEARGILASHAARLRLLLITAASPPDDSKKFQPDFELFSQIGTLVTKADQFSASYDPESGQETSPLESEISRAIRHIQLQIHGLEEKIRALDTMWPNVPSTDLALLAEEFSFLIKWRKSLREARTRLLGG